MSRKKKIIIVVVCIIVAFFLIYGVALAISSYLTSRDDRLGVKLSVSNVSRNGLTYTLERDNPEENVEVQVGDAGFIRKRTLFGWEFLGPRTINSNLIAQPMEDGYSHSWSIKFDQLLGEKLSPGVYQFGRGVSYRTSDGKWHHKNLYVTFVVWF